MTEILPKIEGFLASVFNFASTPLEMLLDIILTTVIAASVAYFFTRRAKQHDFVYEQLSKLYGPIYFFTSQNEKLLKLSDSILSEHRNYFSKEYAYEPTVQENLRKESSEIIETANDYVHQVVENNDKIIDILKTNYSFIEANDTELFQQFVIDRTRFKKEFPLDEGKKMRLPLEVYERVGKISYSRPEFLYRVRDRFLEKQEKLRKLF